MPYFQNSDCVPLKEIAISISFRELYLSFYQIKWNVEGSDTFTNKITKMGNEQLASSKFKDSDLAMFSSINTVIIRIGF